MARLRGDADAEDADAVAETVAALKAAVEAQEGAIAEAVAEEDFDKAGELDEALQKLQSELADAEAKLAALA